MNECSSWEECLTKFYSVKITPDKPKARSLIEMSKAMLPKEKTQGVVLQNQSNEPTFFIFKSKDLYNTLI